MCARSLEYAKSLFTRKVLHSPIRVWSMSLYSSWFVHICNPVPLSNHLVLTESEKFKYFRTELSHTEINPRCRNPRHGFHDQSALGLNGWFLHMICCYCHLRWSSLLVVSCGWASPLYMDLYHFIFFGVKDALTWRLFFLHQFLLKSMVGIRLQARSPQGVWQHSRRSECMDMPCDLRGEMKKTAPILTTHNRIMENRRAV